MTEQLKPGEYVGKDGRKHKVVLSVSIDQEYVTHEYGSDLVAQTVTRDSPDFPAAIAALNELAEAAQWVEYEVSGDRYRVNRTTVRTQYLFMADPERWEDASFSPEFAAAFAALRANGIEAK